MKVAGGVRRKGYLLLLLSLFVYSFRADAQDTLDVKTDTVCQALPLLKTEPLETDSAVSKVKLKKIKREVTPINIYDMPYSGSASYTNHKRLGLNTGVLFGAGFVALGVLQLLPENTTGWSTAEIRKVPFFQRWTTNVKKGPVWDKDLAIFNYVLHPYAGAAYYMGARSQGCNIFYSFLYSAGISTIFWEYGIEAFMEVPSIQDLIITPVAGSIIGEGFYVLKRSIVSNDYRLFGSRLLGNVAAYLIDPVNEVIGIFAGNPCRNNKKEKLGKSDALVCAPWLTTVGNERALGFSISRSF